MASSTPTSSFQSRFRARRSEHCDLPLSNAFAVLVRDIVAAVAADRLADAMLDDGDDRPRTQWKTFLRKPS